MRKKLVLNIIDVLKYSRSFENNNNNWSWKVKIKKVLKVEMVFIRGDSKKIGSHLQRCHFRIYIWRLQPLGFYEVIGLHGFL